MSDMKQSFVFPYKPSNISLCFGRSVLLMISGMYGTAIMVSLGCSMASVVAPQPVITLLMTVFSGMKSSHSDR